MLIEPSHQLNGAQGQQKSDSAAKAGRTQTGAKKPAQSPSQVQSKKVKLDRRQSNEEQSGAKENSRDLLIHQPLLSDTEMTSFLTPTQTDNFENELNQLNRNKRLAESAAPSTQAQSKTRPEQNQQTSNKAGEQVEDSQPKLQPQA